jgi:hypothetical protein
MEGGREGGREKGKKGKRSKNEVGKYRDVFSCPYFLYLR